MNELDQITSLEAMLAEERDSSRLFLIALGRYVRGLDMMARTAYMDAPAGSIDEANAGAIKQHARDLLYWIDKRATEMRSQMDRGMPSDQDDAPPPGEEVETEAVTNSVYLPPSPNLLNLRPSVAADKPCWTEPYGERNLRGL